MNEPLVSIIIPAHNGERYIAEAIQSVLDQDYPNYEIWVIDNLSSDRTRDIVQSFSAVNYVYSDIASTALARNRGLELARGAYIAFLDQDDLWVPEKLSKQVNFLESHPNYGAVIGLQKLYLEPGCLKPHWLKQVFLDQPQPGYLPSALMVRQSVFSLTGHFDTGVPSSSDVAWFFKVKQLGILLESLPEIVVRRRIHGDNTSNQYLGLQKEILSVIKDSLNRRREEVSHVSQN